MNSRHIPENNRCRMSCAVDVLAYRKNGKHTYAWDYYERIAKAVFKAAIPMGVDVEWGGFWWSPSDGMHFQLSWDSYP